MTSVPTSIGDLGYWVGGTQGKPWLVFGGALGTDRRLWNPQIVAFKDQFQLLVLEHPGHGVSSVREPVEGWSTRTLADAVVSVMDALDIPQAAYVGLSLGGSVGMEIALSYGDRLTSLGCCCARGDSPEAYTALWRRRTHQARAFGIGSIVDETVERWFSPARASQNESLLVLARDMFKKTSPLGYCACAGTLMNLDIVDRLPMLNIPCHFLAGEDDLAIPVEVVRGMHDLVADSSFKVLAGAGHLASVECPATFNAWLGSWAGGDHQC